LVNANFFWHGPKLSLYETACLTSFVRRGFEVRMHTFDLGLQVPPGVHIVDAALLANESEVFAYSQGGHQSSIAAFTDIFRYRVLQQEPGWWFDTDVICLSGSSAFERLQRGVPGILVGEEASGKLNGAVIYISDPMVAKTLEGRANQKGFVFDWGDIGPQLLTQFVADEPDLVRLEPPATFYPVHYLETAMLLREADADECRDRLKSAVSVHLWNEFLRRWSIPKDVLPPCGSYLHDLFRQLGVQVAPDTALPATSFESLRRDGEIGRVGTRALQAIERAKQIRQAFVGR